MLYDNSSPPVYLTNTNIAKEQQQQHNVYTHRCSLVLARFSWWVVGGVCGFVPFQCAAGPIPILHRSSAVGSSASFYEMDDVEGSTEHDHIRVVIEEAQQPEPHNVAPLGEGRRSMYGRWGVASGWR